MKDNDLKELWKKLKPPRILTYPSYLVKNHKGEILQVIDLDYKPNDGIQPKQ